MRSPRHPPLEQVELTSLMYALSHPARLGIVRDLARHKAPMSCGALCGERPKSSMSHHFRILHEAGVLETTVVGKEHWNVLRSAELERRFPGLLKTVLKLLDR